ncbi:MAG: carbohydrate kinase [Acidobacteria bacterium]|nr:carbohydrate kinase [Acidobacteriota bacterium]
MSAPKHIAVIDIGKTNAKVALVDVHTLSEVAVCKWPNTVVAGPPYPHYDTEGLWQFIMASLGELQALHPIDAVTVTTHGAAAALLATDGSLAAPILDYEHDGPDALRSDYDAVRPDFSETGSPRLPMGLNLGAQLFWQFETFPEIRKRAKTIVTYPQYWVFRLCGKAVNEVTSLGCHTDLWNPDAKTFSSMVETAGWRDLMAPVAKAADCLGLILPDIAASTGIAPGTKIYCGIHDSNASLYAHLAMRAVPFSIVSTGTWVISMALGGAKVALDPGRDTLVNVNARGEPVPSARFMGGREFDRMMAGLPHEYDQGDIEAVLDRGAMLLPAIEMRSGPFQNRRHSWTVDETSLGPGARFVAVSFYLALMTATGLAMAGADGPVFVEGPFAANQVYLDMLAAATGRPVSAVAGTGTSIGAAMLAAGDSMQARPPVGAPGKPGAGMAAYAEQWRSLCDGASLPQDG